MIGPSILYAFYPIPKILKNSLIENSILFSSNKQPHILDTHKHFRNINLPGIKESWDLQVQSMDPNNFVNLSFQNYNNKIII